MHLDLRRAIFQAVDKEPLAKTMGMKLVELEDDFSAVEMVYQPQFMDNIYKHAHGGVIFSLIDEAFETVGQTSGTICVGLNVNVTYISSPKPGSTLRAEAKLINRSKKTATYYIDVKDQDGKLIATCQALGFNTGKPIPFYN